MTIEWVADTCLCIIQYVEGTFVFVNWTQRCREHGALDNQPLLDAALALNASINNQSNLQPTDTRQQRTDEIIRVADLRFDEQDRIRRLGPPDKR